MEGIIARPLFGMGPLSAIAQSIKVKWQKETQRNKLCKRKEVSEKKKKLTSGGLETR